MMISWHIAARVCMNHSADNSSLSGSIVHKSSQQLSTWTGRSVPGKAQLGTLTWIRHQAAGKPAGVTSDMSPWIIKEAIQRRV